MPLMLTFTMQVLILRNYPPPLPGPGRRVFFVGRTVGAIGRVLVALCVVGVAIAAAVDQRTLLLSFLLAYPAVLVLVVSEIISSSLMLLGHHKAARHHGAL